MTARTRGSFPRARRAGTDLNVPVRLYAGRSSRARVARACLPHLHQSAQRAVTAAPSTCLGYLSQPLLSQPSSPIAHSSKLAGVPGFEPGLSVLETDVLTVDTIPLRLRMKAEG